MSPEAIQQWVSAAKPRAEWTFTGTTRRDTSKWTHAYHRYPAKFIPQLTEKLMHLYPATHINDPFVGSGTTLVSACSQGIPCSGTDINPLAVLLTRVKCRALAPLALETALTRTRAELTKQVATARNRSDIHWPASMDTAAHGELLTWFSNDTLKALAAMLTVIEAEPDIGIREFLTVCFSHILKTCSYWRQNSNKPYRDKAKKPTTPMLAFIRHIQKMQTGNAAYVKALQKTGTGAPDIRVTESSAAQQPLASETADLVIMSSPYVTSYEYADLHRLSALWLGFQRDKNRYIGTSVKADTPMPTLISAIAQAIVSVLPQPKSRAVERYYAEMQAVFKESYRILKPGGRCCYVIGNTKFKHVQIRNAEVFAESLQAVGFTLDTCIKREIPWKGLPQVRDAKTGRFTKARTADRVAYPSEYIVIAKKSGT